MIDMKSEFMFDPMFSVEQLGNLSMINYPMVIDGEDTSSSGTVDYNYWDKFDKDFPELSNVDDILAELDENKDCMFLNHDCMWAGHCGNKEHAEEPRSTFGCFVPKPPVIKKEFCSPQPVATGKSPEGQESLLKPSVKAAIATTTTFVPSVTSSSSSSSSSSSTSSINQRSPLTPPESDDEENKAHTSNLLRILNEAINECDLDEDSDLTAYFEGKEVEVKEEPIEIKEEVVEIKEEEEEDEEPEEEDEPEDTESSDEHDEISEEISYQQYRIRTQMAAVNDHSYHKDKNAVMRHSNYGLDTPSDSEEEEEIDVVSVSDKFTNASRIALSLPNNPSYRDRHQLQKRVATAMSKKRINNGIKTILPVRSASSDGPSSSTSSSSSTSATGRRGTKRGRGTRTNNGYKRRRTNIDLEREPTDKRHLHNDMERQRRVDLRIAFENLKSVVPEVSGTKKIAKVNILLKAAQFCYNLTGANINHTKQLEDLRRKQVWLRSRVSQLRRNLAARR